jgi:hypothetical protein
MSTITSTMSTGAERLQTYSRYSVPNQNIANVETTAIPATTSSRPKATVPVQRSPRSSASMTDSAPKS